MQLVMKKYMTMRVPFLKNTEHGYKISDESYKK
jgi:hypothetical protein